MCITIDNFFVYLRIMIAPPFRRNKKYKQKNNTQIIADKKKKNVFFWFIKKEDNHNVYKRIKKFINQHQDKYINEN